MKILLLISLLVNIVLGYKMATTPKVERTIIEAHDEPRVIEKKIFVQVPGKTPKASTTITETKTDGAANAGGYLEFDQKAYEQVVEKVSSDRETYLQETLALNPEDLQKIEQVKKDFYKQADKLILGHAEPTIEQRRQLLDIEESRERDFSKIMGKAKWEQFKRHRDEYNHKNYLKQMEDNTLFIPMEI